MAGKKTFAIETVFKVIDRITSPLRQATRTSKNFANRFQRDMKEARFQVLALAASIKTKLLGALQAAALGAGFVLGAGIAVATKEFIDFDHAVVSAGAKFKDLKPGTKGFQDSLKDLKKTARDVGAATQFSAAEAAQGLDFLAMAGFTSKQAMALLPGTVDLATAANMELARATDIASDSLGAFGLMTEDTQQLTKNFGRINDVFAKTVTTANVNMEDLFESVKKGAPVFTTSGQSLESFNALVGTMANSGIKGSEAGTSLRNMMLSLAKPTGEAKTELKKLGIQTVDSKGNFRDVFDIINDVRKSFVGMGNAQQAASLKTVFGKRTVTGFNILLNATDKQLRDYRKTLEDSGGAAKLMADTMRTSLLNRLKILKSSLIEVGFKFLDAFAGKGSDALDGIIKAVNAWDVKGFVEDLKSFFSVIGSIWSILKPFLPIIIGIVLAWKTYSIALGIAAAAQMAFNIIAMANPIGIIITAIGLLIGVIYLLVKNWDLVKLSFINVWKAIVKYTLKAIDWLAEAFSSVYDFIMDALDIPIVKILGAIFLPFITFTFLIIKHWDTVKGWFVDFFDWVKEGFIIIWDVIKGPINSFFDWFKGKQIETKSLLFELATSTIEYWNEVKVFLIDMFMKIIDYVQMLWNKFLKLLDNPFFKTAALIFAPWLTIPALIIKHWEKISSLIGSVASKVASVGKWLITPSKENETDEDDEEEGPGVIESPESMVQKSVSISKSRAEVFIKPEPGTKARAAKRLPQGVTLAPTGAF